MRAAPLIWTGPLLGPTEAAVLPLRQRRTPRMAWRQAHAVELGADAQGGWEEDRGLRRRLIEQVPSPLVSSKELLVDDSPVDGSIPLAGWNRRIC